ncbi:replication factor C large subunit [Acidianus sulfidivorans JP7]|uniref:Replication factor C large subunit n=1 Tax=Acidianus sulfidivorans JP7 TaxID=619593 RepID=A0A2U9IM04_9CREN|nr:replication factor C large subunit [Acidianus sulfidivorans]AWR97040.1 replication factor C large subunit [Acidianus sulfidivorans JP7]
MTLPWIIKYRPKTLNEVENQEDVKEELKKWISSWLSGKIENKAVLLYGPPGSGKTTIAQALAHDFNLELLEMNASDTRNITAIKNIAEKAATSGSLFGIRGKLIFLDEVDGINTKEDTGAIPAILELIRESKYPVLMAANDPWDPSLRELRNAVKMIEVKKLGKYALRRILQNICNSEKLQCSDDALDEIIEVSDGDSRYAINLLEATAEGFKKVTVENVKEFARRKDRELDPFETVRSVFWAKYAWQAKNAVSNSQVDYELLMRWFSENIPIQYDNPEDIYRAYDALSRASLFLKRAKTVSWDFLSYTFDMMGPGVAMAEVEKNSANWKAKWRKYQFPQTIQMLFKSKSSRDIRDKIIEKIGRNIHSSQEKVLNDVYPVFLIFYQKYKDEIDKSLDLSPDEIEFLKTITGENREENTIATSEAQKSKSYYSKNSSTRKRYYSRKKT